MDKKLAAELKAAEAAVAETEKKLGGDHPDLADRLQKYANLLKQTETRKLDAVNIEARARAIRAKMYAADEKAHGSTTTTKPLQKQKGGVAVGMYLGVAGIFLCLGSLVLNQGMLPLLLAAALLLAVADVVISRTGFWRIALVIVLGGASLFANSALPSNMLTDENPINRFNYATENPELVDSARKLSPRSSILSFSACLPDGFKQASDDKRDNARVLIFQKPVDAAQVTTQQQPQLCLLLMNAPEVVGKKKGSATLFSAARDVVVPAVLQLFKVNDSTQSPPRLVEINGVEYAKIPFNGGTDHGAATGFVYVGIDKKALIVLGAIDDAASKLDTIAQMDASVYTLMGTRGTNISKLIEAAPAAPEQVVQPASGAEQATSEQTSQAPQ